MKLKKSLGQNFLKDIFYLDKIITSSQIDKTKNIVEIGPGDGALTELILQNSNYLKAFEIDKRFCEFLKKKYIDSNIEVINKNFLEITLRRDHFHIVSIYHVPVSYKGYSTSFKRQT